jgi:hypothetical protein
MYDLLNVEKKGTKAKKKYLLNFPVDRKMKKPMYNNQQSISGITAII